MPITLELLVPLKVELNEAGGVAKVEGIWASDLQLGILNKVLLTLQKGEVNK